MKAVLISDIHIGRLKYGKLNTDTGVDLRTEDILNNIDQAIDYAVEKKAEAFFILGDIYHTKRPISQFRKLFSKKVNRILGNNIDLFIILGNHDQGKTSSHDLIEFRIIDEQINKLHVYDNPSSIEFQDSLLCFLPHVNKIEHNLSDEDYYSFNLKQIKELSSSAKKSNKEYKFFFAHFGTDKSIAGNSFDLGTIKSKKNRVVPLSEFDKKIWTKVYLGDIHKQQEMNPFCRHVGSIARVDFGEENEPKGFYYLEDDKDTFINVEDRELKTFDLDLMENAREKMGDFCESIQEHDLSKSIIRLKVKIGETDRKLINFAALDEYVKDESWKYIGRSMIVIKDDDDVIIENEDLNYIDSFNSYVKGIEKKFDKNIYEGIVEEGQKILSEVIGTI